MSTLRQDPTTREWVILAPQRDDRPSDLEAPARPRGPVRDASCPFCPGHEDRTPPEILRRPPGDEWRIRVVPNLYGALAGDGPAARSGTPMFRQASGAGAAEVIVESPRHDARLDELSDDEVAGIILVWRERLVQLLARSEIRAVVIFKNFGSLAGTSLLHPHSQVVGVPVFPPRLLRRLDVATRIYDENGTSVYDDLIQAEREVGDRVVDERGKFVSFEPWASRSPFETWILPTIQQASFGELQDADVGDLAALLRRSLAAIRRACADPDFNLVIMSVPSNGHPEEAFRWHLKVVPRLSTLAGFELGSGMSINTVPPEDAALALRGALAVGERPAL